MGVSRYGENPDGTLKEGVIYMDGNGEVTSVKKGETVIILHGNPFLEVPVPSKIIKVGKS